MQRKVIIVCFYLGEPNGNRRTTFWTMREKYFSLKVSKKSHIIVKNNEDQLSIGYSQSDERDLVELFDVFNISKIVEIHNWDNLFDGKASKAKQAEINSCINDLSSLCITSDHVILTIVEYSDTPRKYIIPLVHYKEVVKHQVANIRKSKTHLSDLTRSIHQYKFFTSYHIIFKKFRPYIVKHVVLDLPYVSYE